MNLSVVPDFLAISGLVWMFALLLKQTQQSRMRYWLMGWVLILLHIAAQLVYQNVPAWASPGVAASLVTLLMASVAFIWAGHSPRSGWIGGFGWTVVAAVPDALFVICLAFDVSSNGLLLVLTALGATTTTVLFHTDRRGAGRRERRWLACSALVAYAAQAALVLTGQVVLALTWMLCWHYLAVAYFFCRGKPGAGHGALFTTVCFVAWACVFPAAYVLDRWAPGVKIEDEAWNLPKFLVATGMIFSLLEEQLGVARHAARHDPLTGLPNRRLFVRRLDEALAGARQVGGRVAVMVIDMDDFKQVNDTLGHAAGDALLVHVANQLQSRLRTGDTLARLGGDEFAAILPEVHHRDSVERLVETLRATLREGMEWQGSRIPVRASLGIAFYPDDGSDEACLYAAADRAMYAHKQDAREARSS